MRKRRAILFDDDGHVLDVLKLFFESRGYEVIAHRGPVLCPVYDCQKCSDFMPPCGDLMMTDYKMPGMSGIELLRTQTEMGCRLTMKNKAIMSGHMDDEAIAAVQALGCGRFDKPFTFAELSAWVAACEERMDLSAPLKTRRRELRQQCSADVAVQLERSDGLYWAHAINWSDSGLCIKVRQPLAVGQMLDVSVDRLPLRGRHLVRWSRPAGGGSYLAGMSRC